LTRKRGCYHIIVLLKKILLTLVGVAGLSGVSWGDIAPVKFNLPYGDDNPPTEWLIDDLHEGGLHLVSGSAYGLAILHPSSGGVGAGYQLQIYRPGGDIYYSGSDFSNLIREDHSYAGDPSTHDFPATINFSDWIADQETFDYLHGLEFIGDALAPPNFQSLEGSAGAFVTQAQDLNVGLVFQDGQWAPAE
jgi:hypothetical protein